VCYAIVIPNALSVAGAHDKQGRYVRIQLLDNNYLSLAEVQVMGVDIDILRFSEVDFVSGGACASRV
jgi:hypothetical protein